MVETWYSDMSPWLDLWYYWWLISTKHQKLSTWGHLRDMPGSYTGCNGQLQPMMDRGEWKTPKLSTVLSLIRHHLSEFPSRKKPQLMQSLVISLSHFLRALVMLPRIKVFALESWLSPALLLVIPINQCYLLTLWCRIWSCSKNHSCNRYNNLALPRVNTSWLGAGGYNCGIMVVHVQQG